MCTAPRFLIERELRDGSAMSWPRAELWRRMPLCIARRHGPSIFVVEDEAQNGADHVDASKHPDLDGIAQSLWETVVLWEADECTNKNARGRR